MNLSLYNTQSRQVQEVISSPGSITMYCCGPTVYRDAHVGNLRTFLLSDLIARALRLSGNKVTFIQNITDVGHLAEDVSGEDKILAQAKAESTDPFAIARKYEEGFHHDLSRLGIIPADHYPRASESIDLMIQAIATLIEENFAYVGSDGSVYFDATSFPTYGAISGNRLDALKPGHRYEYSDEIGKRFHADWSLWKSAGSRTEMIWDSPWGPGFPGWHIECTAMSLSLLAGHVNVHIGGIDLRFPHHENERAQSNAITGGESVDLWVHGEHLLFEGRKMSKSAQNVVLLQDLVDKGLDPLSLRFCFLENRYRSQMDLSWASLEAAHATLQRWRKSLAQWGSDDSIIEDIEYAKALMKDLDTPRAMQRLRTVEKSTEISNQEKRGIFLYADQVLGLDLLKKEESKEVSPQIEELLAKRAIARQSKDWAMSDSLRDQLAHLGILVSDGADGQSWTQSKLA
jgi:cysteinyl-tRNA synthetase